MAFCHLHRHSQWSLLDGCGTEDVYCARAKEIGQTALAMTDHATLAGVLHHIEVCKNHGLKPIVGVEAYFRPDRLNQTKENLPYYHLILLVKDDVGFKNLIRLTSEAWISGFYFKPCVDWDLLSQYRDGLIASSACIQSPLNQAILKDDDKGVEEWIRRMQAIFGQSFLFEIMPHDSDAQRKCNTEILALSKRFSVPVVATVDTHYPYQEWAETQDVLLMINTGQTISRRKAKREGGEDVYSMRKIDTLYLMDESEVAATFAKYHPALPTNAVQRAIQNTQKIADLIKDLNVDRSLKLPKVHFGLSTETTLRTWCEEGMRKYGKTNNETYRLRLDHELAVLKDMGVMDYFVIMGDVVRWAKKQRILVGVGRGSAAGSLISYLIGITGIDPISHGLLFERFLNPGRKGMPDIDVDFQHNRVEEVREYVRSTYGSDKVIPIGAYQRFLHRSAINDVARVLDVPYADVHKVTSRLDALETASTLEDERQRHKWLDAFAEQYPEVWRNAVRLEGSVKAISKHPAGLIVTDKPATEDIPIVRTRRDGVLVSAWSESHDMHIISDYGFLKFDFLSTDSLTIQDHTIRLVKERTGYEIDFELPVAKDPHAADPDILAMFARGQTFGTFQFNSRPLTALLRKIKPTRFADLAAANALIRPGPANNGMTDAYAKRKNGSEEWESNFGFLAETYGLLVYQEQVMRWAQEVAGFTLAQADDLRRAIGKKIPEALRRMKEQFINGCLSNGHSKADAIEWWDLIDKYSGYAFNLAHAAGYAYQAYQDGWLKKNFPLEFLASVATYEPDKLRDAVREVEVLGYGVLPPDINRSHAGFSVVFTELRWGLGSINGIGLAGSSAILEERAKGDFGSFDEFCERMPRRTVNKRIREILVECGAFDVFGMRNEWTEDAKAEAETRHLGIPLHGVGKRQSGLLAERNVTPEQWEDAEDGHYALFGGEIVGVKEIKTKRGNPMGFVDLAYGTDQKSVTVFTGEWLAYRKLFVEGTTIIVYGPIDKERDCIILNRAMTIDQLEDLASMNGNSYAG